MVKHKVLTYKRNIKLLNILLIITQKEFNTLNKFSLIDNLTSAQSQF